MKLYAVEPPHNFVNTYQRLGETWYLNIQTKPEGKCIPEDLIIHIHLHENHKFRNMKQ